MKLTQAQEDKLRELAFAGMANKQIAEQLNLPLTEVYAQRSRLGITRDKVALKKGEAPRTNIVTQQLTKRLSTPALLNPVFENAVQEMADVNQHTCATCAQLCFAKTTSCTAQNCAYYITREDRLQNYLCTTKQDFLNALHRGSDGLWLGDSEYKRIKELLDEVIPDTWRREHG